MRPKLFLVVFAIFSFIFLRYFIHSAIKMRVFQSSALRNSLLASPTRLVIPGISVDADIEQVGVTPSGEMGVPNSAVRVGWFKLGPRPGEKGSAVMAGHFDGENGEPGVFMNLHKVKKGDKVIVEDGKGNSIVFIVRESRTYNSGYADEVFNSTDSAHLNLITCDGLWHGTEKSYSKRLVVFTDQSE